MTLYTCKICLVPCKEMIKYRSKLLSRNCQHCTPDELVDVWVTYRQSYDARVVTFFHLGYTIQLNVVCGGRVKHSVESFVHECAVQFNTQDFIVETYVRKKLYEKCRRKFRIHFPGVLVSAKLSMSKCLMRSYPRAILTHPELYMRKFKDVKFAVSLVSVFSLTLCVSGVNKTQPVLRYTSNHMQIQDTLCNASYTAIQP